MESIKQFLNATPAKKNEEEENKRLMEELKNSRTVPKAGEYVLHLFIIETSKLLSDQDLNAFIEVKACDQVKRTRIIPGLGMSSKTRWNENFYFTKTFNNLEELENEFVVLTMFNHKKVLSNVKIGSVKRYLFNTVSNLNEMVINQWDIFTDSEKDFGVAKGFIRYSMSFSIAEKERVKLDELSFENEKLCILEYPTTVQPQFYQMQIHLFRGRKIYGVESSGLSDPIFEFYLGEMKVPIKHQSQTANPTYYETIYLRYSEPTMLDRMVIKMYDYNSIQNNVLLGTVAIALDDIKKGFYFTPKWIQFYGSSRQSKEQEIKMIMNNQPNFASTYTGEALMSIESFLDPKASFGVKPMIENIRNQENLSRLIVKFTLQVEIDYAYNLDLPPGNILITIDWGTNDNKKTLSPASFQNKLLLVNKVMNLSCNFDVSLNSITEKEGEQELYGQIPDVFLYLTYNSVNIAFYKFEAEDLILKTKQQEYDWTIKLKPDMSVSNLTIDAAGHMKLRIGIKEDEPRSSRFYELLKINRENDGKIKRICDLFIPEIEKITPQSTIPYESNNKIFESANGGNKYQPVYVMIQLFQAKNLVCVEEDGLPDTYVDFYHFGSNVTSTMMVDNMNPCWSQSLLLKSNRVNGKMPNMVVNVYDNTRTVLSGARKEIIGWLEVPLTEKEFINDEDLINFKNPTWRKLTVAGGFDAGEILFSVKWMFQSTIKKRTDLIDQKSKPLDYYTSDYYVKVMVQSLQNLKPKCYLPLKRTEIKLNTSFLSQQQTSEDQFLVSMFSLTSGNDPLFNQPILLSGKKLPEQLHLIPALGGTVIDNRFAFFKQNKVVGNLTIDMGLVAYSSKIRFITKLELLKEHRIKKQQLEPDNKEHKDLLRAIDGLLKHLSINLDEYEKYIKNTEPNFYVNVILSKEEYRKHAVKQLEAEVLIGKEKNFQLPLLELSGLPTNTLKDGDKLLLDDHQTDPNLSVDKNNLGTPLVQPNMTNKERIVASANRVNKARSMKEKKVGDAVPDDGLGQMVFSMMGEGIFKLYQRQRMNNMNIKLSVEEFLKLDEDSKRKYFELGYKGRIDTRHYRLKVLNELEKTEFMGSDSFNSYSVTRGAQFIHSGAGFFDFLSSKMTEKRDETGVLRAKIDVIQEVVLQEIIKLDLTDMERAALSIPSSLDNWKNDQFTQRVTCEVEIDLFVYVVVADYSINLDWNSQNDSYVQLEINGKKYKGVRMIKDNNSPNFYERLHVTVTMPHASLMKVQFMNKEVFHDELIGETHIDIFRRYLDTLMLTRDEHPIETRDIYNEAGDHAGHTSLWVDFYLKGDGVKTKYKTLQGIEKTPYDIEPRPPTNLYIRIVIWDIFNAPIEDVTGAADYCVIVSMPNLGLTQKSDVHYRSQDGDGSFNWRFEFELTVDQNFNMNYAKVNFRVFDKELVMSDLYLCDLEIDFKDIVRKALETESDQKMFGATRDCETAKSEIFFSKMALGRDKIAPNKGRTLISLSAEVLTKAGREMKPAGLGRSAPNDNPFLPPPNGRFQWSWNPIKLFQQTFGASIRGKMCLILVMALLIFVFIIFAPILVSSIISALIVRKI
jgi:hypothetical protein